MTSSPDRSSTDTTASHPGLTSEVAAFITEVDFDDVPNDVLERARISILDGIGLAMAGSASPPGATIAAYLAGSVGIGAGPSTLLGTGRRVPPRFAALANAIAIHADDYDDTQLAAAHDRVYGLLTHPTAPALAAALAVAEDMQATGREFLTAYLIGVEVECKIAEAISPRHYQDGFHSTATCGTFGAAAAAARLRHLTRERTQTALGIAGTQAGGLRENFGTMTKSFQVGRAAESGVVAVDLAALGWTASTDILEASRGFFRAAGGGYDPDAIHGRLGAPWTFAWPGVSIKPFPSGSLTHPGMTAMAELIAENHLTPDQVRAVRVGTNQNVPNALIHHHPTSALQAKFSLEYCLAILLLNGRAGFEEFTDECVNGRDVQEAMTKVDVRVHPEAEAAGYDKMATIVEVELHDGRVVRRRRDFALGSPQFPMTPEQAGEKFRDCARRAPNPPVDVNRTMALVRTIEHLDDTNDLTRQLWA